MMTTSDTSPVTFAETQGSAKGYEKRAVDAFLLRAREAFEAGAEPMTAAEVRQVAFPIVRHGYAIAAVDAALGRIEDAFAAREREAA
ncbi:MAG: DivIVA domain-containing protein, partial [Microbacterium sp.]